VNIRSILLVRVTSSVDKDVDHPQFFDPPYALKYIQGGLARYGDLSVRLHDCWIRPIGLPRLMELTANAEPDLVVVSASSFDIDVADRYADGLKAQERSPLVVGIGQGFYPKTGRGGDGASRYDAILLGEPEEEFFSLFDRIRSAPPKGNGWIGDYRESFEKGKRFVVEDPDRLAFPTYSPEELEAYRSIFPVRVARRVIWGYLIATRGCPHGCLFCSEVMRVSTGRRLRCRSTASVADEMEHLVRQGVNICSFQDDSFTANRNFVQSLCEELIRRGSTLPWMARARVDELSRDLLLLMKRAGCILLGIGVESGSERVIRAMRKHGSGHPWVPICRQVFRWTRELGIGTNAYYLIGNPGETREEIEETMRLAQELDSDSIQIHFYTPYPGSDAWDLYQDLLAAYDPKQLYHYARPVVSLSPLSPDDLVTLRSRFYRHYILRPGFALRHLWRFGPFYLHNPDILRNLLGIRKIL
jgi:anaerobic magnesium-protoporphyrin IX monomethyl ester cyclase